MARNTDANIFHGFPEIEKSDYNSRSSFRRLLHLLLILIIIGIIIVVLATVILIHESDEASGNENLQKNRSSDYNSVSLRNNNSIPTVKDGNGVTVENRVGLTIIQNAKNLSEDFLQLKQALIKQEDAIITDDWFSSDPFFHSETTTKPEDTSVVSVIRATNNNLNKDCEKSPFDKEFVKTLSPDERNAVEKLMEKVTSKLTDTFCDASSENYLVRWLKHQNWDVDKAAKAVFNTIAWRKKEKIDELQNEDFSYFDEAFPIFTDGRDYIGRVVITLDVSSVNPRLIVISGKGDQMLRHVIRTAEKGLNLTREAQFRGENVTQAITILNLQGFNMKQHGCEKCVSIMNQYLAIVEEHYPYYFFKFFFINTPQEFEWMLHLIKSVLPSYIDDAIEVFGTNKQEWQKVLLEYIPPDQIRSQFGGNKTDHD